MVRRGRVKREQRAVTAEASAPDRERRSAGRGEAGHLRCEQSRETRGAWRKRASRSPRNGERWRCAETSWARIAREWSRRLPGKCHQRFRFWRSTQPPEIAMRREMFRGASGDFFEWQANHALRGNIVPGAAKIGAKGHFQSGDGEFIHAQGAEQRVAAHLGDQILFPGDDARLRPAQQVYLR